MKFWKKKNPNQIIWLNGGGIIDIWFCILWKRKAGVLKLIAQRSESDFNSRSRVETIGDYKIIFNQLINIAFTVIGPA